MSQSYVKNAPQAKFVYISYVSRLHKLYVKVVSAPKVRSKPHLSGKVVYIS